MSSLLAPARLFDSKHGEFRFVEETHEYFLGDRLLWNITAILRETGYVDATWFKPEHRIRGQKVHNGIRLINKGTLDWSKVDDEYVGYLMGYEKLVRDHGIVPIRFEVPRYHPELLYAGTADIVTEEAIWELKTGEVRPAVALQTIGQDLLECAWECRRKRRTRYGVRLNKDGTYDTPVKFKEWARDEAVWRNLVAAVNSREMYGIAHKSKEA